MQKHGGQDINVCIDLIEDFSVTTNYLGLSPIGLLSMTNNIEEITHYPNQNQEPFKKNLANWLYKDLNFVNNNIIIGNGASELIDLLIKIIRYDPNNNFYQSTNWKPGSSSVQYIEYERSCSNYLYNKKSYDYLDTDITCIINPCNPTGEYKNICDLKKYIINNCKTNSVVIIDESMQPWLGENFRKDSMISQYEWINEILKNKNIVIFIIHSWTKFFCCTGLRIGSIICPNDTYYQLLLKYSVPWSCNIMALKYLNGCIKDDEYINKTWLTTTTLRNNLAESIKNIYCNWNIYGESFLSWIWIDTLNNEFAKLVYDICKLNGIPIRLGIDGYNLPSYIRIAVRSEKSNNILINVLKSLQVFNQFKYPHIKIPPNLIVKHDIVDINKILCHEHVIENRTELLYKYIESLENTKIIPSIIVDINTNVLIDGHHRLSVLKKLNYEEVSVLYINYYHPNIIVNPDNELNIVDVILAATNKNLLKPKSTQHMIKDLDGNIYPIVVLSNLYSL